jgi:hypothetical protein
MINDEISKEKQELVTMSRKFMRDIIHIKITHCLDKQSGVKEHLNKLHANEVDSPNLLQLSSHLEFKRWLQDILSLNEKKEKIWKQFLEEYPISE